MQITLRWKEPNVIIIHSMQIRHQQGIFLICFNMQYASSIGSLVSHIVQKIILFLDLEHAAKNTNKNKKWKGIDI